MTHRHLSDSTICAAAILTAWRENDFEQLSRSIADASALEAGPATNAHECERLDLLGGIAVVMRGMMASGQIQDATVYIPLLDHLASHGALRPDRAFM
jgi:hypothetical protein